MYAPARFLLPIFFGMLLLASESMGQWTTYTAMPGTRWAHVCAEASGQLYVLGGSTGPTWEYNPGSNSWITRANIPTQRSYPAVASWNNKVYVLGGSVGAAWSTKNECYDSATDTWTTLADMPQARTTTAAAAVNGRVYVLNGWNGTAMTAVDVYDIATDTWTTAAAAPTGRSHAKTAVVNNRIYLIGGYAGGWTNINEVYDPATNTWQTLTPMPTARYIHAMDALGPQVFVAGGYSGSATNVFQSYDVATNSWTTETAMPTARYRTDGATVNGCFYVLGGYNGSNLDINEGFCRVILPVPLELKGWTSGDQVVLSWDAAAQKGVEHYLIERSDESEQFVEVGQVSANAFPNGEFLFSSPAPAGRSRLYRVVQIGQDGSQRYSSALTLGNELQESWIVGYSEAQNQLTLNLGEDQKQIIGKVLLFDIQGRELESFDFENQDTRGSTFRFQLSRRYNGVFIARVYSTDGRIQVSKLLL